MRDLKNGEDLTMLPNIGRVLRERLHQAGIENVDELVAVGSENAFLRLNIIDSTTCLHELMALEGAVQGIRWHDLDWQRKCELKAFFGTVKAQTKKRG